MSSTTTTPTTAHLSAADVEAPGAELDAMRRDVMDDLGEDDARYIRSDVAVQRGLVAGGRAVLLVSALPPAWIGGTAALSVAKILDSSTWEWDSASSADGWKHSHNYLHHTDTNVLGKDRDTGYATLRGDPEQPRRPHHLVQLLRAVGADHARGQPDRPRVVRSATSGLAR